MNIWQTLGLEPTADKKSIKLAYAARLKQVNPEEDPQGFQALRAAYDSALRHADGSFVIESGPEVELRPNQPQAAEPEFEPLQAGRPARRHAPAQLRPALPELALERELDKALDLDLRLETPAQFETQRNEPWPPGPRPITAKSAPQKLKSAPAWPAEGLAPGRAAKQAEMLEGVRQFCADLMQLDAPARPAAFNRTVRDKAWDSLEARGMLEAALVHHVGGNCARFYPLVSILRDYFGWQTGDKAQLASRPIDVDIASMLRRAQGYLARDSDDSDDRVGELEEIPATHAGPGRRLLPGVSPAAGAAWLALAAAAAWAYFHFLA